MECYNYIRICINGMAGRIIDSEVLIREESDSRVQTRNTKHTSFKIFLVQQQF